MSPYMRKCWICGKEYSFCPVCQSERSWRAKACTAEHYQINQIITEYREGILTAVQAKEKLENIGFDGSTGSFLPSVGELIQEILSAKRRKKKTEE